MGDGREPEPKRFIEAGRILEDLKDPALVSAIDLARWVAAFVVMIGHARFPILKGYGLLSPEQRPIWVQGWYFVTGYFVEAVLVFFVLSGFLVGGMVCARVSGKNFIARGYAIDRFSRLYTAFLPALLLSVLLTWIGSTWFNGTGLYDATHPTFAEKGAAINFIANTGWTSFFGNAAMLQFYAVEPYGSNPPLWTLSSEFWFYAVFGAGAAAAMRRGGVGIALALGAIIATLLLGPMFWFYFAMWLIGVVAAIVRPPRFNLALPAIVALAAMLLFRRYADGALSPHENTRLLIQTGICLTMGLLLLGWRARKPGWLKPMAKINHFMADFSYSLYLTHFPVLILFYAVTASLTGNPGYATGFPPTDGVAIASYGAAVLLSLVLAWSFAQLTEKQTPKIRGWMKSRTG